MFSVKRSPSFSRAAAVATTAVIAAAGVTVVVAGCDSKGTDNPPYGAPAPSTAAVTPPSGAPLTAPDVAAAPAHAGSPEAAPPLPAGGPVGAAPFMGMGDPTAPLTPTPDLDAAIATAEKGGDKKAIAAAYTARGSFRNHDEKAGARVKYRAALDDYRKALAADPTDAEAKSNKDQIESIYKSMGRPIPGADGK